MTMTLYILFGLAVAPGLIAVVATKLLLKDLTIRIGGLTERIASIESRLRQAQSSAHEANLRAEYLAAVGGREFYMTKAEPAVVKVFPAKPAVLALRKVAKQDKETA